MARWDAFRLAVGAMVLTNVWRIQDFYPPFDAAAHPLLLSTIATLGLLLLDHGAARRTAAALVHPLGRLTLALVLVGALSVPASLYFGLSVEYLLRNLIPAVLVMAVVAGAIRDPGDATRLAAVMVGGAAFYCATALLRFDVGPGGRLGMLVYYDANDLGMLLVATLPLAAWLALRPGRPLGRVLAAAAIVLLLVGVIRTGSRGAFIGLVVVAAYVLFTGRQVAARWRIAAAALAVLTFIVVAPPAYWNAIATLRHPEQDYNWAGRAPGGRMEVWKRGISYMVARPVVGVGIGAFPVAEGTISPLAGRQSYGRGVKWSAAHNSFIQIGAELGVAGLLLFLATLATAFRVARRSGPLGVALAGALLGYVVTASFLSQAYAPFLFALLGLVLGLGAVAVPARARVPASRRVAPTSTVVVARGA